MSNFVKQIMPSHSKNNNCHCPDQVQSHNNAESEHSTPPIRLSTDILTDVLAFLTRPQMDTITFTCRHIHRIIESRFSTTPCRFLQEVYVGLYSQKFFFVYLAESAQESIEGWSKTRYSKQLSLDWRDARRQPVQQRKVFGDYLYGKHYLVGKHTKFSGVHISFTPSHSARQWSRSVDELVDQTLELSHFWKDTCLFLSFNHFNSSKLEGGNRLLNTLFGRLDGKNCPQSMQLELSDRNKGGEIKLKLDEYKGLRACQTVHLNVTDECFDAVSLVEYLHDRNKRKNQTMQLFLTNKAATRLIAMLKQRFVAAETSCSYQLSIHCVTTDYNGMTTLSMLNTVTKERLEMSRDSTSLFCPPYQIRRCSPSSEILEQSIYQV